MRAEQSRAARKAARSKHLWTKYGLTTEQYDQEYAHQQGRCMYCRQAGEDLGGSKPMVPDEEHDPPFRFRGLGHPKCNQLAGIYEQGWRNPPAFEDGGVSHVISADRVAARVRAEEMSRTREARRKPKEEPGERQTYHYPSRPNMVEEAMREVSTVA